MLKKVSALIISILFILIIILILIPATMGAAPSGVFLPPTPGDAFVIVEEGQEYRSDELMYGSECCREQSEICGCIDNEVICCDGSISIECGCEYFQEQRWQ